MPGDPDAATHDDREPESRERAENGGAVGRDAAVVIQELGAVRLTGAA